ncbi:MAG TPA: threonine ammonia-lyase [Pirellulales bacterium]|nr:threonine ammonia-lyase [Pirellulales bacterium]
MSVLPADIVAARSRIAGGIAVTPCPESIQLSELCGARIYCKLEYLQRTGSFKERGARNALLQLNEIQRKRGVVAASAGNHALGLAYHGNLLGVGVTVVMPRFAPLIKVSTCRRLGARIVLHGETYPEAIRFAHEIANRDGFTYIHGFNDPAIIAGQGTLGLELVEQAPNVEAIIVPIGGAGLIAGVATAVKSVKPEVRIFGVEAEQVPTFTAALAAGHPVDIPLKPTLADGLAVGRVGDLPFAMTQPLVERVVTVSEEQISLAILRLAELEKSVVEGAAAAALAACMNGALAELAGRHVAIVLTGGNIDLGVLGRVIEHGLVADGRLCRFTATISDRPGGLAKLAERIAAAGASIQEITHDRAFCGPDVTAVNVLCTVETADRSHIDELFRQLRQAGIATVPSPEAAKVT